MIPGAVKLIVFWRNEFGGRLRVPPHLITDFLSRLNVAVVEGRDPYQSAYMCVNSLSAFLSMFVSPNCKLFRESRHQYIGRIGLCQGRWGSRYGTDMHLDTSGTGVYGIPNYC